MPNKSTYSSQSKSGTLTTEPRRLPEEMYKSITFLYLVLTPHYIMTPENSSKQNTRKNSATTRKNAFLRAWFLKSLRWKPLNVYRLNLSLNNL